MNDFIITHFNYFNITHFNYKNAYLDRNLFCKRTRQAISNSLTSSVAEVFRFLFCRVLELYCEFVIIGSRMKELFTGL